LKPPYQILELRLLRFCEKKTVHDAGWAILVVLVNNVRNDRWKKELQRL
jgi:hypothetical protein